MVFAFDVDGTLTAAPDALGAIMRSLRAAGHTVLVLTATGTQAGRAQQLGNLRLGDAYDELIVCPGPTTQDAGPQKAAVCRERGVAVLVDDNDWYQQCVTATGTVGLKMLPH